MDRLAAAVIGLVLDRLVGDPDWLWRRLPHPVVLIGNLIGTLDRRLNREALGETARRRRGVLAITLLVTGALLTGFLLAALFAAAGPLGLVLEAVVLAIFLAQKSLIDHVRAVADALDGEGITAGRRAVAMIVGRDPEQLDAAGVSRAAIESLAENASDGIVAPLLWYLVLGLPGLIAYKVVNTADSMIGHMSERHRAFGWAAAKMDDVVNWPAARLTALLFALAAGLGRKAGIGTVWAVTRRDAPSHRSPNAGWPEAAMAAALGLSLGGPRRYGEIMVEAPMLNPQGRREAESADIRAGIALFDRLSRLLMVATALLLFAAIT
ncbi:cobalamin biosynthesis protein [Aurantimonas aggregata]|uniref:Cobalamin biosynthesis protein CobD n=1 Tax=Aurantimonas aggregata TaxID=2047720 RepID=A0A6L9MK53_9HYPH|nr:cobalamin biosynthesis protein [Aurantimonas aggregata]